MAGSYLGKLRRKRLVDFGYGNVFTYRLSKLGKEILFKNKL